MPRRFIEDTHWLAGACAFLFAASIAGILWLTFATRDLAHENSALIAANSDAIRRIDQARKEVIVAGANSDLATCYDLRASIIADARFDKTAAVADAVQAKKTLAVTLRDLGLKSTVATVEKFQRQIDRDLAKQLKRLDARIDRYDPAKCLRLPLLRQATERYGVTFTLRQAGW